MKFKILFYSLLTCMLASCVDLYNPKDNIDGPYFVATDYGDTYKTLYYDLGDGNAIGRCKNIKRAGHTRDYIIIEVQDGFYFIDQKNDDKFKNGKEVIGKLQNRDYFLNWLDSMQIENFYFDFYIEK